MDNRKQTETWHCFVNKHYSNRPRFADFLGRSWAVEKEKGCEVHIPVQNSGQERYISERIGEFKNLLEQQDSEYSSLLPVSFFYHREDGTIVEAEEAVPRPIERRTSPAFPSLASQTASFRHEEVQKSKERLSDRIDRFARSIYSIKSGGKRYTTPLLGWIALPVFLAGWIVSLFEKK